MADVMGPTAYAIYHRRTHLDKSQRELAERVQESRHTVVNIENNKADGLKMNILLQILSVLGLEVRLGPVSAGHSQSIKTNTMRAPSFDSASRLEMRVTMAYSRRGSTNPITTNMRHR